jgi:hypothetical protein
VGNEKVGGSENWQMLGTMVTDVLFSFNLAAILKNSVSISAHSSPMINHQPVC